eukprot:SM000077S21630  [mRNA]  locus=s77:537610:541485:- [translate_table: standard]
MTADPDSVQHLERRSVCVDSCVHALLSVGLHQDPASRPGAIASPSAASCGSHGLVEVPPQTITEDAVCDIGVQHFGGRQEPRLRVDGSRPVVEAVQEAKVGINARIRQVITAYCSAKMPPPSSHLGPLCASTRDDLAAKVIGGGEVLGEHLEHGLLADDVDAHGRNVGHVLCPGLVKAQHCCVDLEEDGGLMSRPLMAMPSSDEKSQRIGLDVAWGIGLTAILFKSAPLGFSANSMMRPVSSIFMSPKAVARFSSMGKAAMEIPYDTAGLPPESGTPAPSAPQIATGTGGRHLRSPAKHTPGALLRCQDLNKALFFEAAHAAAVGAGQMPDVNFADIAVDAVADGNVDQPVVGAQGHRRLGALLREWVQPGSSSSTEDHAEDTLRRQSWCDESAYGVCGAS